MTDRSDESCCVCGANDRRILVEVVVGGDERTTLCGSHALLRERVLAAGGSASDLRDELRDRRRGRTDRRKDGDELGMLLSQAFAAERRQGSRRA